MAATMGITGTWWAAAILITSGLGPPQTSPLPSTEYQAGTSVSILSACSAKDFTELELSVM